MKNNLKSLITITVFCVAALVGERAMARTGAVLIVGTQAEVRSILSESSVMPVFSEEDENAVVAVQLVGRHIRCFEGNALRDLLRFVGGVVGGGAVYTVHLGSDLWWTLESLPCTAWNIGRNVLHAARHVLSHFGGAILDGTSFTLCTARNILAAIRDIFFWII